MFAGTSSEVYLMNFWSILKILCSKCCPSNFYWQNALMYSFLNKNAGNTFTYYILEKFRRCLRVKFHPGMTLVPRWNHPCLWWNVSYCLHIFAEMKFHPAMKDRDQISSRDEKKRKSRVNTSFRDEILKWACFFHFWLMYSSIFSKFNMFEHDESLNIMKHKASLWKVKPEKKKDDHNK